MNPIEQQLYGNISGMPDSKLKQLDGVFGADNLDDIEGLGESLESGQTSEEDDSDDLRNYNPESEVEPEIKPEQLKAETVINNPKKVKEINQYTSRSSKREMLLELDNYFKLLKKKGIDVPDEIKAIIAQPHKRHAMEIKEARDSLKKKYNNSETSEHITEWILSGATIASKVFNGKNKIPTAKFRLNLNGYPQQLRRRMKEMSVQNIRIAEFINGKLGDDIVGAVKAFSLYIMPLILTIMANHGGRGFNDVEDYSELSDSEDGDEEEEEDEDEEEEEEDDSGSS